MNRYLLIAAMTTAIYCDTARAQDLVTVRIREPQRASSRKLEYTGECARGYYALAMSREPRNLELTLNRSTTIQLTDLQLGKKLLNHPIVGEFSFHCLEGDLQIRFYGFLVNAKTPPKPVSYFLAVDFDGKIVSDWGLIDEDLDVVAHYYSFHTKKR